MDVALSDMMGLAFAEHLSQFASSKGVKLGTITKIEQNPDQSKHLETATLKIFGLDIDLVNLRSEEYAVGSRIPTGVVNTLSKTWPVSSFILHPFLSSLLGRPWRMRYEEISP